jgi:hypothetical protein
MPIDRFRVRPSAGTLFAFFVVVLALAEAHECAHILTARIVCGGWGVRDFSVWSTAEGCSDHPFVLLATFAGPLFTYAVMWASIWMLRREGPDSQRSIGIVLIFGALPFARVFTAITGHGDEVSGFTELTGNHWTGWMIGLASVFLLSVYPLACAYRKLAPERRPLVFCALLIMPILLHGLVIHGAMNSLLRNKVWSANGCLGSPWLVNVWQVVLLVSSLAFWRRANELFGSA